MRSKYQPPELSERDVANLWAIAVEEMKDLRDTIQEKGLALNVLRAHAVDVYRLAADHGMEVQQAPLILGLQRIRPIGSKTPVTYMGPPPE